MSTRQSPPVPPHRFAFRIDDWTSLLSGSTATDDDSSPEQTYALLQTKAALAELSSYLQHQLNQLVHGGEAIMNTVTMKQAIECYASQTGRLNELCAEWSGMLAMLTSVAGTLSGMTTEALLPDQLDKEIELWRAELLDEAGVKGAVNETIVTAKLAAKPLFDFKSELSAHIQQSITQTKHKMLDQLVKLVDREVLSNIAWFADDKCTFHHFTRECMVEYDGTTIADQRAPIAPKQAVRKRTFTHTGHTKRSLVRNIQHLVNARPVPQDEATLPIPRRQQAILEALPTWISPAIKIVEGTVIRATVAIQDQGAHQWTEQRVVEDKVYWHNDPAIVLGPFVLSAWGQNEIEEEVALREQEGRAAQKAKQPIDRSISAYKLFGFLSLMVACVFMVGWRFSSINVLLSLCCGLVSCTLLSARWKKVAADRGESDYAFGYAMSTVATSLLAMLLVPAGFFVVGIVFFILALVALALYANRTKEWDEIKEEPQSQR